jgi:hypothetical protein
MRDHHLCLVRFHVLIAGLLGCVRDGATPLPGLGRSFLLDAREHRGDGQDDERSLMALYHVRPGDALLLKPEGGRRHQGLVLIRNRPPQAIRDDPAFR